MKRYCLLVVGLTAVVFAQAQFRTPSSPLDFSYATTETSYLRNQNGFTGIRTDPALNYRFTSPMYTFWPGAGQSYWVGGTMTQSYNKGKFGTIYTYDNLGNIRYANPFIDIAGKNKRGLKLLLPSLNQRMFR